MKYQTDHLDHLLKPITGEGKLDLPTGGDHHHGGPVKSIRKATYKGKEIEVHTTYEFFIDGEQTEVHAEVMNDGKVHCHNLPQYAFTSAIRMMKSIIDVMDFKMPHNELAGGGHTSHDNHLGNAGMHGGHDHDSH
ncbi:MAG: hypothetical protein AAF431_13000 [Pseudomonadota bacterium]